MTPYNEFLDSIQIHNSLVFVTQSKIAPALRIFFTTSASSDARKSFLATTPVAHGISNESSYLVKKKFNLQIFVLTPRNGAFISLYSFETSPDLRIRSTRSASLNNSNYNIYSIISN